MSSPYPGPQYSSQGPTPQSEWQAGAPQGTGVFTGTTDQPPNVPPHMPAQMLASNVTQAIAPPVRFHPPRSAAEKALLLAAILAATFSVISNSVYIIYKVLPDSTSSDIARTLLALSLEPLVWLLALTFLQLLRRRAATAAVGAFLSSLYHLLSPMTYAFPERGDPIPAPLTAGLPLLVLLANTAAAIAAIHSSSRLPADKRHPWSVTIAAGAGLYIVTVAVVSMARTAFVIVDSGGITEDTFTIGLWLIPRYAPPAALPPTLGLVEMLLMAVMGCLGLLMYKLRRHRWALVTTTLTAAMVLLLHNLILLTLGSPGPFVITDPAWHPWIPVILVGALTLAAALAPLHRSATAWFHSDQGFYA